MFLFISRESRRSKVHFNGDLWARETDKDMFANCVGGMEWRDDVNFPHAFYEL